MNTKPPTPIIRKLFSLELEQKLSCQNHWGNQKTPVSTVLEIIPFYPIYIAGRFHSSQNLLSGKVLMSVFSTSCEFLLLWTFLPEAWHDNYSASSEKRKALPLGKENHINSKDLSGGLKSHQIGVPLVQGWLQLEWQ